MRHSASHAYRLAFCCSCWSTRSIRASSRRSSACRLSIGRPHASPQCAMPRALQGANHATPPPHRCLRHSVDSEGLRALGACSGKARHGILQELVLRLPSLRAIYINGQRISSSPQERNRFAACVRRDWLGVLCDPCPATVCTAALGVRACERARLRVFLWVRARVLACGVASCSAQEARWSHSIPQWHGMEAIQMSR